MTPDSSPLSDRPAGPDSPVGPENGSSPPAALPPGVKVNAASARRILEEALGQHTTHTGSPFWHPPPVDQLRGMLGKYTASRLIGRGGMGAVYLGIDPTLGRSVAIKLLPPELSALPGFAERFRREAWALARLHHPHIVQIYEFGETPEGHLFFVMEYVEGISLAERLARHRADPEAGDGPSFTPAQTLEIATQVCGALGCAHASGILHRDVKPANLLLTTAPGPVQVKLVDFGLARLIRPVPTDSQLTAAHELLGTRDYMAPEILDGKDEIDGRADVYAVGVLLYELLTGEIPRGAFPAPSRLQRLNPRVDQIVRRAMQSTPALRYPDISSLSKALQPLRARGGRPRSRVLPGLLLLAGGTATAAVLFLAKPSGTSLPADSGPSRTSGPAPPASSGSAWRTGLIFEDSFTASPGPAPMPLSGRYTGETPHSAGASIQASGLTYTDPAGNVLKTSGGAACFDTNLSGVTLSHVTGLDLADGPESGIWISLLAQQTAGTQERFFNLCLRALDDTLEPPDYDRVADEILAIGMRSRRGPQTWQVWDRSTTGTHSRAAVSPHPTTSPSFLLVHWERNADGDRERATLWVNPVLTRNPDPAEGFSFTSEFSDFENWSQLRQLRLGAGHSPEPGLSTSWIVDEIRIGWSRESVTPGSPGSP